MMVLLILFSKLILFYVFNNVSKYFFIMSKLSMNVLSIFTNDFQLTSAINRLRDGITPEWRTDFVSELLMCRDGTLISNLTIEEIDLILYNICVL